MSNQINRQVNENSLYKLLLNIEKCENLAAVAFDRKLYDDSYPISIELHLTNRCNLNCEWCVDKPIRNELIDIPYESLLALLDFLEGKNIGITIEGGGEPTIYKHFDEFVYECKKRNIYIGLITNGIRELSESIIKCFSWIRISLDASTPQEFLLEKGKDAFEAVINHINKISKINRDHGIVFGIGYVLTKRNYRNLELLLSNLVGLNIDYIRLRNVEESDHLTLNRSMMDSVEKIVDLYRGVVPYDINLSNEIHTNQCDNNGLPCIAHTIRSIIHANGDVVLCEKRRHDSIILGNIIQNSFAEIWNSKAHILHSKRLLNEKNQEGCMACRITKYNELFYTLTKIKTGHFI